MREKFDVNKDVILFDLLMIFWLLVLIFVFITTPNISFFNYIMTSALILNMILAYNLGLISGLIFSLIIIFIYGSYILYSILVLGKITKFEIDYIFWLFVFPVGAFISGTLQSEFKKLKEETEKSKEKEKFIFLDEITGFLNAQGLFQRLEEEVSRANRTKEKLSVLCLRLADAKDLYRIYGKSGFEKILSTISNEIMKNTRMIDVKGILDEETIGIILPNTDLESAKIVREKLHKVLDRIIVEINGRKRAISLKINIGISEYNFGEDYLAVWQRAREDSRYDV